MYYQQQCQATFILLVIVWCQVHSFTNIEIPTRLLTAHLKRDWINSGTIEILFTISEHSYREPEVGVKFCMYNFTKLVYCKVFLWCGHRGFKPALVNSVYVYVCMAGTHWVDSKIFILFHETVIAKKHRHVHTHSHTQIYKYIRAHTNNIYTHTTIYAEATKLHDMADTLFHSKYGQNGDKPKRRQAKGNITETATKTCGQNGDKGQQNACRKFTLWSTRRHDSG